MIPLPHPGFYSQPPMSPMWTTICVIAIVLLSVVFVVLVIEGRIRLMRQSLKKDAKEEAYRAIYRSVYTNCYDEKEVKKAIKDIEREEMR